VNARRGSGELEQLADVEHVVDAAEQLADVEAFDRVDDPSGA
jgi:hypothetical protein